jgi:hypothetical protein
LREACLKPVIAMRFAGFPFANFRFHADYGFEYIILNWN